MVHLRALSIGIGARRATTRQERIAAEYIQSQLNRLGVRDVTTQPFRTIPRIFWKAAPGYLLASLGLLWGCGRGRWRQISGGLFAIVAGFSLPSVWRLRTMAWERIAPQGDSQNVIAWIPAAGSQRKKIVLLAHLDTSAHRISASPRFVGVFPLIADGSVVAAVIGGLLSIAGLFPPVQALLGIGLLGGVGVQVLDEVLGGIPGANDNASGVAVALGMIDQLRMERLQNTEIWVIFTGAEQSGGGGIKRVLEQYADRLSDALFINLKMVGSGELAWATRQGVGISGSYEPRYGLLPIAERVAANHPELGVVGKPILLIDDLSTVREWGFTGITVTGYDPVTGHAPNLHQRSDTVERINPATLERAAKFVWEMIRELDK
jgi:hypothetical protein